jgi:hypothetical protein
MKRYTHTADWFRRKLAETSKSDERMMAQSSTHHRAWGGRETTEDERAIWRAEDQARLDHDMIQAIIAEEQNRGRTGWRKVNGRYRARIA